MKGRSIVKTALILMSITFPLAARGQYSEQDLWLLEVMINNATSGQVVFGLVRDDGILLPAAKVCSMLGITSDADTLKGTLSFARPGDHAQVHIDGPAQRVLVDGQALPHTEVIIIDAELYLKIDDLGLLVDAELEYLPELVAVRITSNRVAQGSGSTAAKDLLPEGHIRSGQSTLASTKFSISNVGYDLVASWKGEIPVDEGEPSEPGNQERSEILGITANGRIGGWRYTVGTSTAWETWNNTTTSLEHLRLQYGMPKAKLEIGKLAVLTAPELQLDDSVYYGLAVSSGVLPTMRHNGNMIDITGEAPEGSWVTLYVNGWKIDSQRLSNTDSYVFRNVVLRDIGRTNVIRVSIKKPSGETEDVYRYLAASNALLNESEVDYIFQAGRLHTPSGPGDYLCNLVANWGITGKTTIGASWYSEDDQGLLSGGSDFAHAGLVLNQRLTDNITLGGILYRSEATTGGEQRGDYGYGLNAEYGDPSTQVGLEFRREGEQLDLDQEKRLDPAHLIKVYCIKDLASEGLVEASYSDRINPVQQHDRSYGISYRLDQGQWKSAVSYNGNTIQTSLHDQDPNQTNTWGARLEYMLTPGVELIGESCYRTEQKGHLNRFLDLDLSAVLESGPNTLALGIGRNMDLANDTAGNQYSVSWGRKHNFTGKNYLQTSVGYQCEINDDHRTDRIPVSLKYSHILANDVRLTFGYRGVWNNESASESIDHRLTLAVRGAFNFYGGKPVSTSTSPAGFETGMIVVRVFEDQNRNGMLDPDEPLLGGIPVRLNRKTGVTDEYGEARFKQMTVGSYVVGFDYDQLPIELTPSTMDQRVQLGPNSAMQVDLCLYVIGTVDGHVRLVDSENVTNLGGIRVTAEPGGYSAYTDATGYFFFDQLPPGALKIELDTSSLPEGVIVAHGASAKPVTIIGKGEYVSGIDFELKCEL